LIGNTGTRGKRVVHDIDKESPDAIRKLVDDGFKVAVNSLKNLSYVKHPTKSNLRLVEAFPVLPDQNSISDAGGLVEVKFLTNPVPPSSTYDTRLECGILKPIMLPEEEQELQKALAEAHERDPERNPAPDTTLQYEYFTVDTPEQAATFKRKFDTLDPDRDDEKLYSYTHPAGGKCFRFKKMRAYESGPSSGSLDRGYEDEVVISLQDGTDGLRIKGAYYYPIIQKVQIKPQRNKHIEARRLRLNDDVEDERYTDYIDVRIEDPDEATRQTREVYKEHPWGIPEVEKESEDTPPPTGLAAEESQNVDEDAENSDE